MRIYKWFAHLAHVEMTEAEDLVPTKILLEGFYLQRKKPNGISIDYFGGF